MEGYDIGPGARAAGHRLDLHDSLGSTNTEAMARARDGETGPLWIVARRQEAGRGRRGNAWASLPGNLAASLLLGVDDVDPSAIATLGFVAGVALIGALRQAAEASAPLSPPGGERGCAQSSIGGMLKLKWPNDVLAGGAKLAGILLEAETLPNGRRFVVIGLGVNVAAAPEGLPYPATCLRQCGHGASAAAVFERLSDGLAEAVAVWDRGGSFAAIRERWLGCAAGIGAPVSVRTGLETVQGIFETIDAAGRLVIATGDGTRRTVTAGEVHLGTAATAA